MLQITPQHRLFIAVESADFRKGIDALRALCQRHWQSDPFGGHLFIFRNKSGTAVKLLIYDGNGFWLCQKRFSSGTLKWWPHTVEQAAKLRDRLYRRWRRAVGLDKVEWWERHQQAHAEFRTAVKESRRQAWRNHCDAMARDPMKAASKVKQLRRRKMQSHTFTHENGPQAAAEHMCEHLSQVYSELKAFILIIPIIGYRQYARLHFQHVIK